MWNPILKHSGFIHVNQSVILDSRAIWTSVDHSLWYPSVLGATFYFLSLCLLVAHCIFMTIVSSLPDKKRWASRPLCPWLVPTLQPYHIYQGWSNKKQGLIHGEICQGRNKKSPSGECSFLFLSSYHLTGEALSSSNNCLKRYLLQRKTPPDLTKHSASYCISTSQVLSWRPEEKFLRPGSMCLSFSRLLPHDWIKTCDG